MTCSNETMFINQSSDIIPYNEKDHRRPQRPIYIQRTLPAVTLHCRKLINLRQAARLIRPPSMNLTISPKASGPQAIAVIKPAHSGLRL